MPQRYIDPYNNTIPNAKRRTFAGRYLCTHLLQHACFGRALLPAPAHARFLPCPFQRLLITCASEVPSPPCILITTITTTIAACAGMLSCLDEGIGNVTAAILNHPDPAFANNTLVIFVADNGGPIQVSDRRPLGGGTARRLDRPS